MAVSFGSNPSSITAQLALQKNTAALSKTFERLSSGLRINSAADGPADLMLADSLRADGRVAAVAIRNVNDGLSLTAIADSAMGEIASILDRMAELAEQSSNGVYTNTQRSAMELEFAALGSEVSRIAESTDYNDRQLLSNSSSISIQAGLDNSANSVIIMTGVLGTLESMGLSGTGRKNLTYSLLGTTVAAAQSASQIALDAVRGAIGSLSSRRGVLGAAESRLSIAVSHLSVARENFIAAESRIRDADVAQEVADMTRLQVLQQAATAVLAQANLQPEIALGLLTG